MKKIYYVVRTNLQTWGKGKSVTEALKNAQVQLNTECLIQAVSSDDYDSITVDGNGNLHYSGDIVSTSEKPEKLIDVVNEGCALEHFVEMFEEKQEFTIAEAINEYLHRPTA